MALFLAVINASWPVRIRQKNAQYNPLIYQTNSKLEPLERLLKASFYQDACCIIPGLVRGVAQSGSAPLWGCGGRRFKSCRPDQIFIIVARLYRRKFVLETSRLTNSLVVMDYLRYIMPLLALRVG
jgi:hypothetical protein